MTGCEADARAEGHREGVADGLTYAAEWLVRSGSLAKGKAGFLLGLSYLARRGVDLPALPGSGGTADAQ